MASFDALNIPPPAIEKGGNELMRAAIADGELYMSIRRGFDDPEAWGRVLADIAKHVSQIYATETKYNRIEAAQRILDAFAKDMAAGEPGSPFAAVKS
jgi:hypothetical protein